MEPGRTIARCGFWETIATTAGASVVTMTPRCTDVSIRRVADGRVTCDAAAAVTCDAPFEMLNAWPARHSRIKFAIVATSLFPDRN